MPEGYPYGGKVYPTRVERVMAERRAGEMLLLPSLDWTCTGENCKCPHHEENSDDR